MMRIGVVSDSHEMSDLKLTRIASLLRKQSIALLIHLGDGASDGAALGRMLEVPVIGVCGNCDFRSNLPAETVRKVEGAKLLICHGHALNVKMSLMRLQLRAEEVGACVALYGHTHIQRADDGLILLLNPGALPLEQYAVLHIDGGRVAYTLHA